MGPPWFLLPYHLFLPNTNETCQHPGKVHVRRKGPHPSGEGRGRRVGCSVPAHIPGRGKKRAGRWRLEVVVVVDETKINVP